MKAKGRQKPSRKIRAKKQSSRQGSHWPTREIKEEIIADFSDADNVVISGFPHATQKSVVPIVIKRGDEITACGTGFAFGVPGLWATARHAVLDAIKEIEAGEPTKFGIVYAATSQARRPGSKRDFGGPMWASWFGSQNDWDIAVFWTPLPRNKLGTQVHVPILAVNVEVPEPGDTVLAMGYPRGIWEFKGQKRKRLSYKVDQSYQASWGTIEEISLEDRGEPGGLGAGPKLRCSADFKHGMSGGPVVSLRTGAVCGVVSTGMTGNEYVPGYSTATLSVALLTQPIKTDQKDSWIGVEAHERAWDGIQGHWNIARISAKKEPHWAIRTGYFQIDWPDYPDDEVPV